jgi:hypothetical protein
MSRRGLGLVAVFADEFETEDDGVRGGGHLAAALDANEGWVGLHGWG